MKLYELEQRDLDVLAQEFSRVTGDTQFKADPIHEARMEILKSSSYELRSISGNLPDSKLKIHKSPTGDLSATLFPNQLRDTEQSKKMEEAFNSFAAEYLETRTTRGLPK